jgi:multiple sugar transport system permease protein
MAVKALPQTPKSEAGQLRRILRSRQLVPIYYLLPTLIPLLVLTLYPFLRGIWLAFTDYNLYKKDATQFIGINNFVALATDDTLFWGALTNNIVWTVGIVAFTYVLGIVTALALNEKLPLRGLFRGITLIPWVCPAVVAGLTWSYIYEPNFGLLNYLFKQMGLIEGNVGWLSDKNTALIACMVVAIWKLLPFMIVMLLAGLQAVPEDLHEAAAIDGANALARLWYITLPLLNRVGSVAILLCTIWAFNHFDSVYVLTGGGPGDRTMLLSLYAYQNAFRYFKVGYASAVGVVMLLILFVPIMLYVRRALRDEE